MPRDAGHAARTEQAAADGRQATRSRPRRKGPDIPWLDSGTRYDGTVTLPSDSKVTIAGRIDSTDALYAGQVVNDADIVRALYAYVMAGEKIYYWTSSDLGKYIRINRVSFDGGKKPAHGFFEQYRNPEKAPGISR